MEYEQKNGIYSLVILLDVQLYTSRQHMFCGILVDFSRDRVNGQL